MQRAARYYASGKVVTELGDNLFGMAGGLQEATGLRSELITSSILMIRAAIGSLRPRPRRTHQAPPVCTRPPYLCLLQRTLCRARTHRRAHPAGVARRQARVDERRDRVPFVQHRKGNRRPRKPACRCCTCVCGMPQRRLHPQQSTHPRRPDGLPAGLAATALTLGARLSG